MKQQQLLDGLWLAGSLLVLVAQPAWADVTQVTSVQLNPTNSGLEVILNPQNSQPLQVFNSRFGQTFIAHITNAQLRLPEGNAFSQENPVEGITSVTVTQQYTNTIRVKVIARTGVSGVEVIPSDRGLILSLRVPADTTPAQSTPNPTQPTLPGGETSSEITPTQPTLPGGETSSEITPTQPTLPGGETGSETTPTQPTLPGGETGSETTPTQPTLPGGETGSETTPTAQSDSDVEEIVVTASRRQQRVSDVPRSVTVVTREDIEEQTNLSRNLSDTLGNTVPGLSPSNQGINSFGQTLRGRGVAVLIDGVPQTTNIQSFGRELRTIDPSAIERVEVVRGPSATYGSQGTGGVINIITRRPTGGRLTSTSEVGLNSSLTNFDNSLASNFQQSLSGRSGNLDYTATLSRATTGGFYDAEGDRIPQFEVGGDNSTTWNALAKLGWDLANQQRLQLSFNYFDDRQKPDVISDPEVDVLEGTQKARAIKVGELEFIGTSNPGNRNALVNLEYSNPNLLGSRIQSQIYYRNNKNRSVPLDSRPFVPFFPEDLGVVRSQGSSQQLGGRLQVDTPLNKPRTLSLLWGADYLNENSKQPFDIIDIAAYDASNGRVNRKVGERTFVPPYEVGSLGLFGQLQWNASDRIEVNGGVRHERISLSVDDYTTFRNQDVQGGDRDFSATVFNAGAVYKATDKISLFTNFSQGFGLPDFAQILRDPSSEFTNINDSVRELSPQKVNNYEVGVRGNWSSVQASLSAFYNTSDFGISFNTLPGGFLQLARAPERIYGLEATVDWQPRQGWQVGSTLSLAEGESDDDEDGKYLALTSSRITPLKLTAYVENETLPGWRNRLQALFVGNRDRAFNAGVDLGPIGSYLTVDYVGSVKLGAGSLQIGVENLLNNQYYPVQSQLSAGAGGDSYNYAARGRTLRLGYSLSW
ncbi:MAG: TonB-dependent receptor [Aphanothece sp. CMT-3BRIN-NPC111]|nr:TonB-dependent receptor [Aphanothece sp. CMT-3BRIN-NPC111]